MDNQQAYIGLKLSEITNNDIQKTQTHLENCRETLEIMKFKMIEFKKNQEEDKNKYEYLLDDIEYWTTECAMWTRFIACRMSFKKNCEIIANTLRQKITNYMNRWYEEKMNGSRPNDTFQVHLQLNDLPEWDEETLNYSRFWTFKMLGDYKPNEQSILCLIQNEINEVFINDYMMQIILQNDWTFVFKIVRCN